MKQFISFKLCLYPLLPFFQPHLYHTERFINFVSMFCHYHFQCFVYVRTSLHLYSRSSTILLCVSSSFTSHHYTSVHITPQIRNIVKKDPLKCRQSFQVSLFLSLFFIHTLVDIFLVFFISHFLRIFNCLLISFLIGITVFKVFIHVGIRIFMF